MWVCVCVCVKETKRWKKENIRTKGIIMSPTIPPPLLCPPPPRFFFLLFLSFLAVCGLTTRKKTLKMEHTGDKCWTWMEWQETLGGWQTDNRGKKVQKWLFLLRFYNAQQTQSCVSGPYTFILVMLFCWISFVWLVNSLNGALQLDVPLYLRL